MSATGHAFNRIDAQNAMPLSFPAFMGKFGNLTDIQVLAFPVILKGIDAVVVAPAASGKTESALAPICERLLKEKGPEGSVGVLYIVPTRALANDIDVRIREATTALKLKSQVRTGDHPSPVGDSRIDILITTPESFDSLTCRHPKAFLNMMAIIVDEAHLVDKTARGDQLRILIRRVLMKKAAARPQLIAMSATVSDAEALGERLFGSVPTVVRDDRARPMDTTVEEDLKGALVTLRRERMSKAVIFCNTRRKAEETGAAAAKLGPWPPERVMVHHASLARSEREDVEKAFKIWEAGLLIATSTMELGVDIGDVDAVILVGAPESVASLHQRVGRGCRRSHGLRALFIPESEADKKAFNELMTLVRDREMPDEKYTPDISVIIQQTFSILFENRKGIPRRVLRLLLDVLADGSTIDIIIDHLRNEGFLDEGAGEVMKASTKLMDMGEKGRIHSNIADTNTIKVVDSGTGRTVGMVSARTSEGSSVTIGGRNWTVTGSDRGGVSVKASGGSGENSETRFGGNQDVGAFYRYLPEELKGYSARSRR